MTNNESSTYSSESNMELALQGRPECPCGLLQKHLRPPRRACRRPSAQISLSHDCSHPDYIERQIRSIAPVNVALFPSHAVIRLMSAHVLRFHGTTVVSLAGTWQCQLPPRCTSRSG